MKPNKFSMHKILLILYCFIAGALFGGAFAFFIVIPIFNVILAMITGSDAGPPWANYFIYTVFIVSIIGGIYISEKWCLHYIKRKKDKKE